MKRYQKNLLLDRFHKGFVITCIGLTFYGCYKLSTRVYNYFTIIKPAREREAIQMMAEGSSDNAPSLKA